MQIIQTFTSKWKGSAIYEVLPMVGLSPGQTHISMEIKLQAELKTSGARNN